MEIVMCPPHWVVGGGVYHEILEKEGSLGLGAEKAYSQCG